MTLDEGSEGRIRQGSFLFCTPPGRADFFAQKMPDGVASSVRFGIMAVGGNCM